MFRWFTACLAAGLLLAPLVRADEPVAPPKERTGEPIPPPHDLPPAVTAPPANLGGCAPSCEMPSTPRFLLQETQTETTLPVLRLREQTIGVQSSQVLDYKDERRTVTVVEMKARPLEQDVVVTESQPVTTVDCNGHCCTTYQPVPVTKKVIVNVYEPVTVTKDILVRVPVLKSGPPLLVNRLVVDAVTVPAIESRFQLIPVPGDTAPLPQPCPPPACPVK